MSRFIIFAQSERSAACLRPWIEMAGCPLGGMAEENTIVLAFREKSQEPGVLAYEAAVRKIESLAEMADGSIALNEVVALVDAINPARLNAAWDGEGWDHLIAMLILTFPEIKWVFSIVSGKPLEPIHGARFPEEEHCMEALVNRARRDPLLDPTGLREWVRAVTNLALESIGVKAPRRLCKAAAIDEEKAFAYFHGYTAYRFGYRAEVVTSWALMQELFGGEDSAEHGYHLLLEDMSLKFPDKRDHVTLVDFGTKGRANFCPKLAYDGSGRESSEHRVLVTTGQAAGGDDYLRKAREYLQRKTTGAPSPAGPSPDMGKPVGGMWDLWHAAGLSSEQKKPGQSCYANGFQAIPPESPDIERPDHGAPGKLMLIAEVLLRRAEIFRDSACTLKDFIKGATLANDAMELLGGRTPSLTFAALALKHEYEVQAECSFIGVGMHFDVSRREDEIEIHVAQIARWFDEKKRKKAALNAEGVVLNRIARVFRDAGQFDEEQQALVALRWAHRRLMFHTRHWREWPVHAAVAYAEWLLASLRNFALAITLWIGAATAIWWFRTPSLPIAINRTFNSFFGGNPADENWSNPEILFSCAIVAIGIFHIGVFISYVYSLISRR